MNSDLEHKNKVLIRTPDQRLRVFISSTLKELEPERKAVHRAITRLHLAPVMFESGARPHPAQDLYQAYLSQSHVFIGIYWQSYGWTGPGMKISGLEDEYNRSNGLPKLIYIKSPAPDQDPQLKRMLERLRDDNLTSYKRFRTPHELEELVKEDLVLLLTEYFETARLDEHKPEKFTASALTNVPIPRNPLIGRELELKTACNLLRREDVALVTLTGPAGTGKSRLGIQVALELREEFHDGVYLVTLESIRDPALVIPTIAHTLGIMETTGGLSLLEMLKRDLCEKQTLLLLDNFEQVLPAAIYIAELLEASPQVKVLVTSRASLHLRMEKEYPIPPLTIPPSKEPIEVQPLSQYSAVQLFIQRCQAVKADFQVTNENAPAIAEICHRLDGLPLALELAAARIRLMPPQVLLARLEHRFEVLRGGMQDLPERHQTMYNAIDWSYSLLEECDKRLLQRLSVFNGGWTVEAAVAVCADEEQPQVDILDGLERLVDNSLLLSTGEEPGEVRMRVLESIREFASEHLIQSREADTIRYRYAHYYLAFAKQAEVELQSAAQYTWHRQVVTELDNLRAVMDWAIRSEKSELALQITLPLHRFWWACGCWTEAFRWLKLAMAHQEDLPDELNAKALTECGWFYRNLGDYQQSIRLLEESITLWQLIGDEQGFAVALLNMGASFLRLGNIDEANRYLGQALEISRRIGDTLNTYQALELLGHTASKQGDIGKGSQLYSEALALAEEVNDDAQVAKLLNNLGDNYVISGDHIHAEECFSRSAVICKKQGNRIVGAYISGNRSIIAMKLGDYSKAFDLLVEAMLVVKESGDKENTILCLEPFAYVAAELGEPARAARLFGASESLRLSIGMTRQYQMQDDYETYVDKLKSQLGEAAFKAAWENGSNLTLDQAVAFATQGKE